MAEDFSNEGLYLLLKEIKEQHGADLREIRHQTTETNGRVRELEVHRELHDRELKKLNSAVFPRRAVMDTAPPVSTPDQPAITLSLSPKMWALIMGVGGAVGMALPLLIKWAEKALGLTP